MSLSVLPSIRQLALLLLLVAPAALATRQYPPAGIRAQFVRAMNEATQRVEETKHQAALMSRLLKAAKPVKTAFVPSSTSSSSRGAGGGGEQRDLQNYNYQYGYYNYNYNYDNYNNNQQQEEQENEDDAFAAYGGLNLTQYALKYLGCQNIHTFSDEMAANNDEYGSLIMNRFVVFRLCPKNKCSNYNDYGCDYNYGEYTIPMEDYLATMQYYHIQQYQQYCQTCHSCMTTGYYNEDYNNANEQNNRDLENNNNYNYNNGGGGGQYYNYYQNDDGANNGGDDYYARNDDGNNNAAANDDANAANDDANDDMMYATDDAANATDDDGINCFYKDVCHAYMEACGEDMFTDDNYMSYSANYAQYFECAEFNVGNAVSYLGPHCRSDGFTIGIGIYEDQYCSSYIGDMVDMEEVTGQAFDDDYLSPYYPKQCISCMATVSIFNCVFVSFCNVYLFFGSFVLVL